MKRQQFYSAVLIVLMAACATSKSNKKSTADKNAKPGTAAEAADAAATPSPTEVSEASLRGNGEFSVREDLKAVPFEYDSSKLSDEALAVLKSNTDILNNDKSLDVLIAGHCDERGTTAYNLALGQKRAKEVRDYYIRLGIEGTRIATISYGKEQPICSESNDDCWMKNRRAETRARVKK